MSRYVARTPPRETGVVDQDVDVPDLFEQHAHSAGLGQVSGDELCRPVGRRDLAHDCGAADGVTTVDDDRGTQPGEFECGGLADAAGRSGDQCALADQRERIRGRHDQIAVRPPSTA